MNAGGAAGKRVAVVQSNYIPWKGYFDLIAGVDEFILYDDMQYTRRDWRNRNRIKTRHGLKWLSIPVKSHGRFLTPIREVEAVDDRWAEQHWKTIAHAYHASPGFAELGPELERLYGAPQPRRLSDINFRFVSAVCGLLGVTTRLSWSMDYELRGDRVERLIGLCRQAGAAEYVSGPTARGYLDEDAFRAAGVAVHYIAYDGYPEYRQPFPPFEHHVSIVDLLLSEGKQSRWFLKHTRR